VFIDTNYGGGPVGNNNQIKFRGGGSNSNGGCGVRGAQRLDNNGASFDAFETNGNTSHGMLVKSEGWSVSPSCISEGNGGYGYQLGEDADAAYNVNSLIDGPRIESNVAGGVRGSAKSQSTRVRIRAGGQAYSAAVGATDTVDYLASGLHRFGSNDGNTFVQVSCNTVSAYLGAASRTGGDVNLYLQAAGTGVYVRSVNHFIPDTGCIVVPEIAAAAALLPPGGFQTLFIDTADHKLKRKDSGGTVTIIA